MEFRGTEGRPGLISSSSLQTFVCAMGPPCLPRQCPHPGLCPHPMPQVVAPPQESLPEGVFIPSLSPLSGLLPCPHPQQPHACHVKTVPASSLGLVPSCWLFLEAGELHYLWSYVCLDSATAERGDRCGGRGTVAREASWDSAGLGTVLIPHPYLLCGAGFTALAPTPSPFLSPLFY